MSRIKGQLEEGGRNVKDFTRLEKPRRTRIAKEGLDILVLFFLNYGLIIVADFLGNFRNCDQKNCYFKLH